MFILQKENHLFMLIHLEADLLLQLTSLPPAPSLRGVDFSSECLPEAGRRHHQLLQRSFAPYPVWWPSPNKATKGKPSHTSTSFGACLSSPLLCDGRRAHTAWLAEPPDSFFSTPPADVFGGTRCSDRVTHPEKAHTAEDISLLLLPGAPSAIAVRSSFSFLPSQISPKHFCLIFLKDIE